MVERPILFSGPMVRAILSGAKTQTRRVVKPQPAFEQFYEWRGRTLYDGSGRRWFYRGHYLGDVCCNTPGFSEALTPFCPFGAPGDTLWIRETWRADDFDASRTIYLADCPDAAVAEMRGIVRWTPSIHMPRSRSRLSLRVTSVRVERLHAITPADIVAEGVRVPVSPNGDALVRLTGAHPPAQFLDMRRPRSPEDYLRAEWASLWCEINGRASWDADPWVWVVGFERVEVSRG